MAARGGRALATIPDKSPKYGPRTSVKLLLEHYYLTHGASEEDKTERTACILGHLKQLDIFSADGWSRTPVSQLEQNGIPFALISYINETLLLPNFKYSEKVRFLEKYAPAYSLARSIIQLAETVDSDWRLDRKDCDSICHNYQRMAELSMKFMLHHWGQDFVYSKKVKVTYPTKKNDKIWLTHKLDDLAKMVQLSQICVELYDEPAFKRINECAADTLYDSNEGKLISCTEFYELATNKVDPYLLTLWSIAEKEPMRWPSFRRDEAAR